MREVADIFADISAHQIKGLMIHSQLADYYRFLGLDKYADCHEARYNDEICGWRMISWYYVEHYNHLIAEKQIDNPNIIPAEWYGVTRQDVDTATKRRAVEYGLRRWVEWETETKKLYEAAFAELLALGEGAAAMRIKKCMCAVDYELADAQKYMLNKKAVDYDIAYLIGEQA